MFNSYVTNYRRVCWEYLWIINIGNSSFLYMVSIYPIYHQYIVYLESSTRGILWQFVYIYRTIYYHLVIYIYLYSYLYLYSGKIYEHWEYTGNRSWENCEFFQCINGHFKYSTGGRRWYQMWNGHRNCFEMMGYDGN